MITIQHVEENLHQYALIEWIPCTEALPPKTPGITKQYLAVSTKDFSEPYIMLLNWAEGFNCTYVADGSVNRDYEMHDITAWAELPAFIVPEGG